MSDRIRTLEQAVTKLDDRELKRFAAWFAAYQERVWDGQIARDASAGKLDFLIEEARSERTAGTLMDL